MNAYELAYEYVQHTNRCIFLTGKAGTGKTTFLRKLKKECLKQLTVVAPTGVAAINAEGVTIHSLFQLPPQLFLPTPQARKQLFAEMQMRSAKQRVLRNLELLVIDEVSMVRADLLDAIDAVLRHFKHQPNLPFGGVQVLFIGDLFQLSPVAKESEWRILQEWYVGPYFFQAQVFNDLHPVYIELDHVFRQTNNEFVEILNQVRNNSLTPESLQVLNSRYMPYFQSNEQKEHYITLSTHNSKVNTINQQEMERLTSRVYTYKAQVKDTFPEAMFPIDQTLTLKKGARVMFVKNDSAPEKRYYNGKIGVVSSLSNTTIEVTCEDGLVIDVHEEKWENIRYTAEIGSDHLTSEVIGTFTHFPLRLAWAITIHKAQGLTFDRVVIDAADAFASGQVYVALSRCRSLEGVVLHTTIPNRALTNAKDVLKFTDKQLDIQSVEQSLMPAQIEYLVVLLCTAYDFKPLITRVGGVARVCKNMGSVQGDISAFFTPIIGGLEGLNVIAERFQYQIRQIIFSANSDKYKLLKERLKAAANYFEPKIQTLLSTIVACPLRTYDRNDVAYLKQNILDIHADIARMGYVQKEVAKQPTIDNYFKARKTFNWKEPLLSFSASQRKKSSEASPLKSLELLYNGLTIRQIAKERKLTTPTVVKHMKTLLAQDVVHISQFTAFDQFLLMK